MPSLPTSSSGPSQPKNARKYLRKGLKAIMRSHHVHIPKYDMPIRLRPWFVVFTCVIMILLAMLGFTNFSRSLPLNDKLLHFICFSIATGVFYFIFDVEEDARRIWFWRHSGLIFTAIVCFFFGGIVSEFVQSMLPHKEFQFGDIVANLLGSAIGLWSSYHIERYYRQRREISRLYRPLETDYISDESDSEESGGSLLPSHYIPSGTTDANRPKHTKVNHRNLSDVWDEREEVFGVGDDSDNEEGAGGGSGVGERGRVATPKITVTPSGDL